ncbi:MAG: hypothetical protein AAGP08_05335, partial [Pseudomonadota bacterium]
SPNPSSPLRWMNSKKIGPMTVFDGGETKILLQIFSKTVIGPIFFEFIQRKGDDGFGEGNFQALFESIEAEELASGELTPDAA